MRAAEASRAGGRGVAGANLQERTPMPYRLWTVLCVAGTALVLAVPAHAFDCTVANKPAEAGAAGIFDANDNFTPLKPNPGTDEHIHGGFIAFTDGETSTSTFVHAPQGVLPPVRPGGSQHDCDGKGLDSFEVCFGF
jgi:hypothetical protein